MKLFIRMIDRIPLDEMIRLKKDEVVFLIGGQRWMVFFLFTRNKSQKLKNFF